MNHRRRHILYMTVCLLFPGISLGHSPHHVITDVAVSPSGSSGSDVFILITDQVFRSDENGWSWKNLVNGLNNRYSFTSLGISPVYDSDNTLFLASAGDGVFRSTDNGDSWSRINKGMGGLEVSKLSVSSNYENDRRLLAATRSGGVWRSVDSGDSWQRVLTEGVQIVDFAEVVGFNEQPIVIAGDSMGRVWRSADNGRLWEIAFAFPGATTITSVAGSADDLYVGTKENGLFHSIDSGRTFSSVEQLQVFHRKDCKGNDFDQPLPDFHITSIKLSPADKGNNKVFVTTWYKGVFVSEDKGESWSTWNEGLSCDRQADDMATAHFRDLAISPRGNGQAIYWLGAFDGLFRSVGEDSQWQQLETLPLGLIKGMAVSSIAEQSPAIALATYGGGFYLSENRGSDWTIGNKGLLTTRLTDLSFSPEYKVDGVIYAGASRRLLKSSDKGYSWQRIDLRTTDFGTRVLNKLDRLGMPTSWLRSSDSVATSPIYPTFIAALPGSSRVLFATRFHGVMAFDESSESVESVWSGTDQIMNSLTISPNFDRDRTMYSSIRGEGIFRSEDGGVEWTPVNHGLNFVDDWAGNPERGDFRRDLFVAISPGFESDQTLYSGSPAGDGLYVSHDRGTSWARVTVGAEMPPVPVLAIAVSPDFQADNTLLVSIKGQGVFRSVDRGLHFDAIGAQLIVENASIELLKFSPDFANDHSIVAASDESLFISGDRGDSWSEVQRPVRYEDMRDVVSFFGGWEQQRGEQYSAMTETVTSDSGGSASLRFVGGGIRWLGSRGPEYGSAEVYIDDELVATVRCHSSEPEHMQTLFVSEQFEFGAHTIEVRRVAEKTTGGSGIISVDGFDVLPSRITTH